MLAVAVPAVGAATRPFVLDGYAARVNDRVITIGDVLTYIQPELASLSSMVNRREAARRMAQAFDRGLEDLVEQALLLEYAEEKKLSLPDEAADQEMSRIVKERFDNDQAAFREALQRERRTLEDWRSELKDNLMAMMVRRYLIRDKVAVTPREIREYYRDHAEEFRQPEQVHVAVITIRRPHGSVEAVQAAEKAAELRRRLKAGEPFDDVAGELSEDSWASRGGDRGWLSPSDLRPELARAVAQLQPGQISDLIETPDAYYVVKLLDRRPATTRPLEEVSDRIRATILKDKRERVYRDWIRRLRKRYFVEIQVRGADLFGTQP